MHIRITDFAGTFPKLHPTKLPDIAAQSCLNVMVEHGILAPSREAVLSYESNGFPFENFVSAIAFSNGAYDYKHFSNNLTRYAFSPVHESYRLYWTTEDADKALMFTDWNTTPSGTLSPSGFEYKAGMPAPIVKDLVVTGIIKGPLSEPDDEATPPVGSPPPEPELPEGTLITGSAVIGYLKRTAWSGLFQDAGFLSVSSSLAKKKLASISNAVIDAINDIEGSKEARVYAFTYVNGFGDESVPGVTETILYIGKGDKLILTIPFATGVREQLKQDYNITNIRVYRTVTDSLGNAQFLFVKEVGFSLTGTGIEINDDVAQDSLLLGEPLATINYDPPREGMQGLGVTDSGVGYAYLEKTICLTEPYLLYAWPRYYEQSSQHQIMGMGHYDNTIVVATKGNPLLITGISPESMGVISLPLYEGCISSRSMVNLNYGCMYASENGLVLVSTNSAKLLTEEVFATDDWQKINPSSIHACAYKNGYLFFWDNGVKKGSGYLDLNNSNKGIMWFDDYADNTFIDDGVVQMITTEPNGLGVNRSVYRAFNPEYGQSFINKQYVWRSKTFNLDTPKRFLAGQLLADDYQLDILFKVFADGVLIYTTTVKDAKPFRIANHSAKRDFSIEVSATTPIREIALGETMRDMIK